MCYIIFLSPLRLCVRSFFELVILRNSIPTAIVVFVHFVLPSAQFSWPRTFILLQFAIFFIKLYFPFVFVSFCCAASKISFNIAFLSLLFTINFSLLPPKWQWITRYFLFSHKACLLLSLRLRIRAFPLMFRASIARQFCSSVFDNYN